MQKLPYLGDSHLPFLPYLCNRNDDYLNHITKAMNEIKFEALSIVFNSDADNKYELTKAVEIAFEHIFKFYEKCFMNWLTHERRVEVINQYPISDAAKAILIMGINGHTYLHGCGLYFFLGSEEIISISKLIRRSIFNSLSS